MTTQVSCHRCGATALVEKFSWEHTSIQWQTGARDRCRELAAASDLHPGRVPTCSAMDETIRDAVRSGQVPVDGRNVADVLDG